MTEQICAVEGCSRGRQSRDWCNMHYLRWRNNGDPVVTRKPGRKPKTDAERFWPKVSKVDGGCWLWAASVDAGGYGRFDANGHQTAAHR